MEAMNATQQTSTNSTNNAEQRTAQWTRDIEALCQELGITQSYENPINTWRPGTLLYLQVQHMILKQLRELVEEAAAVEYAGLTLAEIPAKELTALVQRVDKMQRAKDRECEAYAAESRARSEGNFKGQPFEYTDSVEPFTCPGCLEDCTGECWECPTCHNKVCVPCFEVWMNARNNWRQTCPTCRTQIREPRPEPDPEPEPEPEVRGSRDPRPPAEPFEIPVLSSQQLMDAGLNPIMNDIIYNEVRPWRILKSHAGTCGHCGASCQVVDICPKSCKHRSVCHACLVHQHEQAYEGQISRNGVRSVWSCYSSCSHCNRSTTAIMRGACGYFEQYESAECVRRNP